MTRLGCAVLCAAFVLGVILWAALGYLLLSPLMSAP